MAADRRKKRTKPAPRKTNPRADLEEADSLLADLESSRKGKKAERLRSRSQQLRQKIDAWGSDQAADALRGLATAMTSNLDQRSLVKQILELAVQSLGAERGILFLGKGEDMVLAPVVAIDISGEELEQIESVSRTILKRGQKGEVLVTDDASKDPRFRDAPSVSLHEIRSVLCAPLKARGEAIGVIYLDAPTRARSIMPDASKFLESYAGLAAVALENARIHGEVVRENTLLRRRLDSTASFERLLTLSPRMNALLERASIGAQVDAPVLIRGESGSGRELLARAIHQAGSRVLNPFVAYNCAAVPRELIERVLFGHARGSHEGAQRTMPGLFREADRGTLFLNEVGDLEASIQERVLRAATEGLVTAVGSRRATRVDVHLITATSRDLREDVRRGRFNESLYYALNVIELAIPPLRERPEDIPLLIDHFLQKHAPETGGPAGVTFTPQAVEFLQGLAWRGNVRELESLVRRVLVMTDKSKVDVAYLKKMIQVPFEEAAPVQVPGAWPAPGRSGQVRPFKEQEREALREALIRTGGNKSKAARLLGLHRNTLLRRIKKLGVLEDA